MISIALTDSTKVDFAFKKMKGLSYTTAAKAYYEELNKGGIFFHNDDLIMDEIPIPPPSSSTSVIEVYGPTNRILLTKDTTVANSQCWFADQPIGYHLPNWIPPYYWFSYGVRIFESDNTTEIVTVDPSDWIWDYKAGCLTFQDACPDPAGIYLQGYRYIGTLGAGAGGGSGGCLCYTETVSTWTLDGSYQYADISHNLDTSALVMQLTDNTTKEYMELQNYKVTDDNTVRLWITSGSATVDITILACGGLCATAYTGIISSWTQEGSYWYADVNHSLDSEYVDVTLLDVSTEESVPYHKYRTIDNDNLRVWVNQDTPLKILVVAGATGTGGGQPPYREDITPTISMYCWDITHNLGRDRLLVNCYDVYGDTMIPWHIEYADDNRLLVHWEKMSGNHPPRVPAGTIVCY